VLFFVPDPSSKAAHAPGGRKRAAARATPKPLSIAIERGKTRTTTTTAISATMNQRGTRTARPPLLWLPCAVVVLSRNAGETSELACLVLLFFS